MFALGAAYLLVSAGMLLTPALREMDKPPAR